MIVSVRLLAGLAVCAGLAWVGNRSGATASAASMAFISPF